MCWKNPLMHLWLRGSSALGDQWSYMVILPLCFWTGDAYLGARPAAKKVRELCASITEQTSRRYLLLAPELLVGRLNRQLRGWANYFCYGSSKAVRLVDRHVARRLRRWLCRKHKVPNGGYPRFPDQYLTKQLGLVRLPKLRRNLPCAKA